MKKNNIMIEDQDKGKRLDVYLTEKFSETSRSQWQKKVKNGGVSVNGEKPSVHQFLKVGDEVEIIKNKETKQQKIAKKTPPKYKLLEETKDYLIVEKPAGVLTHTDGKELGLADAIVKDYPEIKNLPAEFSGATAPQRSGGIGANREAGVGDVGRWGVVHRLDKGASGLLVIARTKKFFEYIKKQFAERKIDKIYLALVYGEIPKDEDTLDFSISRGSEGRMAAHPKDEPHFAKASRGREGREAKTHIKILQRYTNYTFLEARIETGRTHQIRAHMLAYGHGIVGDKIYKSRRQKIKNPFFAPTENALRSLGEERAGSRKKEKDFDDASNVKPESRLFLHSHILGFENMDGKFVEYKSKLPKELNDCLKKLTEV